MGIRDTYQDLMFPGYEEKGFKDTFKTWEAIKEDFTGKSILDIGCNQGYFMLRCMLVGANSVTGIDLNGTHWGDEIKEMTKPLDIARDVFKAWGYDCQLIEGDWEKIDFREDVDIILCLSTLHYFKKIDEALRKMFRLNPELLIFEARSDTIVAIKKIAAEYDYEITEAKNSHWNSYKILKLR